VCRFGISLVAVLDTTVEEPHLQLNPGPSYILKATDFCFYMSVTKEEYAKIQPDALKTDDTKSSRAKNMGNSFYSLLTVDVVHGSGVFWHSLYV